MPFLHLPFSLFRTGLSLLFAQVSGICQPQNKWLHGEASMNETDHQAKCRGCIQMAPSQQLDDRQKWNRLRAAFSYFLRHWWVGLAGVFSPGEVSQRTCFPQTAFSGTVLSWALSKHSAYVLMHLVGFLRAILLLFKGLILQNAALCCRFLLTFKEGPQHSTDLGLETFQEKVTLMGNYNRG